MITIDHDDIIKWKHFPRNWPFVWRIHRTPVNSPYKGQWCRALMFSLICTWINGRVNNGQAGDLRCHHAHYDATVMDDDRLTHGHQLWLGNRWFSHIFILLAWKHWNLQWPMVLPLLPNEQSCDITSYIAQNLAQPRLRRHIHSTTITREKKAQWNLNEKSYKVHVCLKLVQYHFEWLWDVFFIIFTFSRTCMEPMWNVCKMLWCVENILQWYFHCVPLLQSI